MNSINPLPADDRLLIQAYTYYPSFSSIVEELVVNSLEAGATSIELYFDLEKLDLQIRDNGCFLYC